MITEYLVNKFVKDKENVNNRDVRENYGRLASVVGLILNLFLVFIKITAGLIANSVAIIGDGINQLTDSFSSILAIISFKISNKPADKEHPYGHARYEYFLSSIVSLIIIYVGFKLLIESINKIAHPGELDVSALTIVVLIVSIFIKLWMNIFYTKIAKKIDSQMLTATSLDAKADVYSTGVILLATLVYPIFNLNIDGIAGAIVSILIIINGYKLLRDVIDKIVGYRPGEEDIRVLEKYYLDNKRILAIHDLMFHDYGGKNIFVTVHAEMNANETLRDSHALIDTIENRIHDNLGYIVTTHIDPVEQVSDETLALERKVREIVKDINPNMDVKDFRILKANNLCTVMFSSAEDLDHDERLDFQREVERELRQTDEGFNVKIVCDDEVLFLSEE